MVAGRQTDEVPFRHDVINRKNWTQTMIHFRFSHYLAEMFKQLKLN